MKLNSMIRALAISATLTATSLFANAVKIEATGYDGGLDGGEFLATISQDNLFSTKGDNESFLTFCLEKHVGIELNKKYTYTIDEAVLLQNDKISVGTAYLYEQFIKGTLISADGSGNYFNPAERYANAGALQHAFWMLENEELLGANYYLDTVLTAKFGSIANAMVDAGPSSKVKALNVWNFSATNRKDWDRQSLLVYVPDSGMTAALLGLGLLSLAAFRRKL